MYILGKKVHFEKTVEDNKIIVKRYINDKLRDYLVIENKPYDRFNDITLYIFNSKGKMIKHWGDNIMYMGAKSFEDLKKKPGYQLWEENVWDAPW